MRWRVPGDVPPNLLQSTLETSKAGIRAFYAITLREITLGIRIASIVLGDVVALRMARLERC